AAFVRTKIRNVISGAVTEKTFNPTDKYPTAFVERKDMQYLYRDGDLYYFMDNETYENIPISASTLGDNFKFVKENMDVKVLSYKGNVFGVEPPFFIELEVTQTDPGFKGDTATNATKPATLETGAEIRVPLFINEAPYKVDTRTGEYMGVRKAFPSTFETWRLTAMTITERAAAISRVLRKDWASTIPRREISMRWSAHLTTSR
ncbi:MAG: elongation factor P, partial [Merdibacter sp.]